MLADPCADPRILPGWSRPDCQKTALTTFLSFFVLNFYSFTVAYQWFISKKSIILLGFGGGGGGGGGVQPIPKGQTFSMGEGAGGPNAYSRNP